MTTRQPRSCLAAVAALGMVVALGCGAILSAAAIALKPAAPPRIDVVTPTQVRRNTVYDVTISGFSHRRAKAYLFIDYQRCSPSFATEQSRAAGESQSYAVRGSFARTSGWRSAILGYDHACAYLVSSSSNTVLATAMRSYRVH